MIKQMVGDWVGLRKAVVVHSGHGSVPAHGCILAVGCTHAQGLTLK